MGVVMVSAIGSSLTSGTPYTTGTSTAAIEAKIARYQKELSDCVNCASAQTTEGKAKIEAITSKISTAEARIEQITTNKQASQPAASSTTVSNNPATNIKAVAQAAQNKSSDEPALALYSSETTTGSRVDIFA